MEKMMRTILALSAALAVAALTAPVASAAGSGKYCLKGPGSTMKCNYKTMAACDKAKKGSQSCVENTSTTGAGAKDKMKNDKMKQ